MIHKRPARPGSRIVVGLTALLALGVGGAARAETLVVGGATGQYATIANAVNAANSGDSIEFASSGTFQAPNFPIDKDLAFVARRDKRVSIAPPASGGRVFTISSGRIVSFDHLTIRGGRLTGASGGGGIYNAGTLTLVSCTLTDNTSEASGGAIYNSGSGTLTARNCTFAGNAVSGAASAGGGAIRNDGTATFRLCTVTANHSSGVAGGLDNRNNAPFTLEYSLVAGNTATADPDAAGKFTSGNYVNLVGVKTDNLQFVGAATNLVGTPDHPLDARLGPLQDNGGITDTVALLTGSPAIDAVPVDAPDLAGAVLDQRDVTRPLDGGDGDDIPEVDLGAYEASAPLEFYVSTSGSDSNMGTTPDQPLATIHGAVARIGASGIIHVAAGIYVEDLTLSKSVTVQGIRHAGTLPDLPLLVGATADRSAVVVYPGATVHMSDIAILPAVDQHPGTAFGYGAGVFNEGDLTLERSYVQNGNAVYSGGNVTNYLNGTMTLRDCTISGGTAELAAGVENDGEMLIEGCTITGNTASSAGGAIGNTGMLSIINSTISGNAAVLGGGIYNNAGLIILQNVTVANNTAAEGGGIASLPPYSESLSGVLANNSVIAANHAALGPDFSGALASSTGYNLIGNIADCVFTSQNSDRWGTANAPIDPKLGTLADNGGLTQTMSPLPGSPLIDAGPPSNSPDDFPATDQRGVARPIGSRSDIGAVEYRPTFVVTSTKDDGSSGTLRWAIGQANASTNSAITFAIAPTGADGGVKVITLAASRGALPAISHTTFVDGWSQGGPGYTGPPLIQLDGVNVPTQFGLNLQAPDCVVRGLSIIRFPIAGSGNAFGIGIFGAGANAWVYGCMVGTDTSDRTDLGNGQGGIWAAADGARIGTNFDGVNDAAEANVVAGNGYEGILITGSNNTVAGNIIGAVNNPNGNVIQFGGVRVQSGSENRITRNSIAYNLGQGIDLAGDGITVNDPGDDDGGANTLQNYPVITGVTTDSGVTTISGSLNSTPDSTFTVEVFDSGNPVGIYREGQHYLASTTVKTDGSGNANFSVSVPAVASGRRITATATNAGGNTSEFSLAVAVSTGFTVDDLKRALRLASGLAAYSAEDSRLNVETAGASANRVDMLDCARLARKVAGTDANP